MTPFDLLPWLLGLALVALAWWHALGARAVARRAARRRCREAGVHFIDELAFRGFGIGRGRRGGWWLQRHYGFEFYQRGDRRYRGWIELSGLQVTRIQLEPHPGPGDVDRVG